MYYDFLNYVNLDDLHFLIHETELYYAMKQTLIERLIEQGFTKMGDGRQLYELDLAELIDQIINLKITLEPCSV